MFDMWPNTFNLFTTNVPVIYKQSVNWFGLQINWMVFNEVVTNGLSVMGWNYPHPLNFTFFTICGTQILPTLPERCFYWCGYVTGTQSAGLIFKNNHGSNSLVSWIGLIGQGISIIWVWGCWKRKGYSPIVFSSRPVLYPVVFVPLLHHSLQDGRTMNWYILFSLKLFVLQVQSDTKRQQVVSVLKLFFSGNEFSSNVTAESDI